MRLVDTKWSKNVRNNLALLIKKSGKTQKELCKEMGFNESLLSEMLVGKRLTIGNVAHVTSFFGVSIDWLVGYEPTEELSFEDIKHDLMLIKRIRELLDEA